MKWLLFILSVMTFTVETKNSVSTSGELPDDIQADYACTYQKGIVRNGDTATLTLTNLELIELESVQVYLRSNKSSGAGKLTIVADNQTLYEQSGHYNNWFGSYSNTTFQPLTWTGYCRPRNGTLQIQLVGTENSLYIEKYQIQYTAVPPVLHHVTLYSEGRPIQTLTEPAAGIGISLPGLDNRDGWVFYGWSTTDITDQTMSHPASYAAHQLVYPSEDMSLYAVWASMSSAMQPLAELTSGYYTIVHKEHQCRLRGEVANGSVALVPANSDITDADFYYVDFNAEDSTCIIRYFLTDSYLSYGQTTLSKTHSQPWHCYPLQDSTFLFSCHRNNTDVDVLYPSLPGKEAAVLRRATFTPSLTGQWQLYLVTDEDQPVYYWSYPSRTPLHDPQPEYNSYIVPMGIYQIHIHNGQKTIHLSR